MAAGRRQTDPNKWGKKWHRLLTPVEKCFWHFLCDECDWAGVWDPDFERASFLIGEEVNEQTMAVYGDRVRLLENGKYWLTGFIDFQQPKGLNPGNRAHAPIFRSIEKNKVPAGPLAVSEKGLAKGLAKPPCNVTSRHVLSCNVEGGPGETADLSDYVADIRTLRPEFAGLPEFGITNTFTSADRSLWHPAYADFRRDMLNALKAPENPLKLLAGYLRKAGGTARRDAGTAKVCTIQ